MAGYGTLCFISIFAVVNPVRSTAALAIAGKDWSDRECVRAARRAVIVAAAILFGAGWIGNHVILYGGIQLGGFRIASGIILLSFVLRQLLRNRPLDTLIPTDHNDQNGTVRKFGVSPLAIPLLAGIGSVATVVLYTGETWELWRRLVTFAALGITLLIAYLMMGRARRIYEALGELGARYLSHLLALTVAAWAVDFIAVGIRDLLPLIISTPPAR